MWDDEDNNPYGSFTRRDSETSDVPSPNRRPSLPSLPSTVQVEVVYISLIPS